MINFGLAMEAMYLQIISPFLHFGVCYYITIKLEYGIIGAALSGTITNTLIMLAQIYILRSKSEHGILITSVKLADPRNRKNIREYLGLAIPSTLIILAEWSAYHVTTMIGGILSTPDQIFVVIAM